MSFIWLIVGAIILSIIYKFITYGIMVQTKEPPKPVSTAGIIEAIWGMLVFGLGVFIYDPKDRFLGVFLMLLGLFWICIAVSLYKSSKVGRTVCLILSILRIPTVIGAFFSFFSMRKLYFSQESKNFFNKKPQERL